jgi:hypothetical protein
MSPAPQPIDEHTNNRGAAAILATIVGDMERDAEHFDGQPFTGRTVAAYLGNMGAAVAAIAKILGMALMSDADEPDHEAPPEGTSVVFLLWSNKYDGWWGPEAIGYTRDVQAAGRFNETEAMRYVLHSAYGGVLGHVTCMVAAPDNWEPTPPAPAATLDGAQ